LSEQLNKGFKAVRVLQTPQPLHCKEPQLTSDQRVLICPYNANYVSHCF
jgi:hypothetical protein